MNCINSLSIIANPICRRHSIDLFSHDLTNYFSCAGAGVEIDQADLLPGSQCQLLVAEWDYQ